MWTEHLQASHFFVYIHCNLQTSIVLSNLKCFKQFIMVKCDADFKRNISNMNKEWHDYNYFSIVDIVVYTESNKISQNGLQTAVDNCKVKKVQAILFQIFSKVWFLPIGKYISLKISMHFLEINMHFLIFFHSSYVCILYVIDIYHRR